MYIKERIKDGFRVWTSDELTSAEGKTEEIAFANLHEAVRLERFNLLQKVTQLERALTMANNMAEGYRSERNIEQDLLIAANARIRELGRQVEGMRLERDIEQDALIAANKRIAFLESQVAAL